MKGTDPKGTQEPVGIVISGLPLPPETTVFSAYVWGPAPSLVKEPKPKAS
jgi:hypothetical protein